MRRRVLLAAVTTAALSAKTGAQSTSIPRIAYLSGRSFATDTHLLEAFRQGLKSTGYVDGQNVTMDIHWADGRYADVPKLMADLVATEPALIAAVGGNPVGVAAKAATSTIPIVFVAGADPVEIGLVSNLTRPEGNVTGMTLWANELDAKRLDHLHDMLPGARNVAMLINPTNPGTEAVLGQSREVAVALGLTLEILNATTSSEIERVFQSMPAGKFDGMAVGGDAFLINRRARILTLAAERRLPAIYPAREFAIDGGLASYGANWIDTYRVSRHLRRPHPQGCQTGRLASAAADNL